MNDNKINLELMTIDQLKVCAYDILATKEKAEHDLNLVNQMIAKKYEEQNKNKVEDATIES